MRQRIIGVVLGVLMLLGFVAFVGTQAVRGNLIDDGFYEARLREENVYERLYTELLTDPEFAPQIDALLGGVDIAREDVAATIQDIARPEYVQALVEAGISGLIRYFQGKDLDFTMDITPIVARIHDVVIEYAVRSIGETPVKPSPSLEVFAQELEALIVAMVTDGTLPETIPSHPLAMESDRQLVAALLVQAGHLDPENPEHAEAIRLLADALRNDDVALAIKVSVAALLAQVISEAIVKLTENPLVRRVEGEDGPRFLLSPPDSVTRSLAGKLSIAQSAGAAAGWARAAGLAMIVLCAGAMLFLFRRDLPRALRWTGVPLAIAGLLGFVAWWIARSIATSKVDAVIASSKGLPPSLQKILGDVTGGVLADLTPAFWIPAITAMVLGTGAIIASIVLRRRGVSPVRAVPR